ncbi:MAG: hypothetical protein HYR95_02765 [Candidatus Colwellbacteria bacterium]|nr:hypothetical protein [Candidatus Colwellbacteria bacterium]
MLLFHHSPIIVLSVHLVGALIAIFFGVLALFHDPKSVTNRALAFLMLSIILWIGSNYIIFASTSIALTSFIIKPQMFFATLQVFGNLLFIYAFPREKISPKKWQVILFIILAGFALAISPFLFKIDYNNVFKGTSIPFITSSALNPPWGIIAFLMNFLTAFIAFKKYRAAEKANKSPFLAVLTGTVATFILLMITQYFLVNVFKIIDLNFYGPVFLMPLVFGTGYAIIKHHLFNIKAIATEILIFSLWLVLLARIFFEKSAQDTIVDVIIIFGTVAVGIFMIKSVLNEVKQKEKLSQLNKQLDGANAELTDLNDHLQQKVEEQTVEIRKSYEVEKKARIELVELDKAKDQFILTTQHHLTAPLTIVKGYLQSLLTKKVESLDEEGKSYITKASDATERVAALVNEFLDISQMEAGKSIISKKPANMFELVSGITDDFNEEAKRKNLTVTVDIAKDSVLSVDPVRLKEALTNVVDNAVKYNNEGGSVSIKGEKTTHPIERDKSIFKLTIASTGIGMTAEELSGLFARYFQRGKEAEKIFTTGRGIGLAVTKHIVEAHKGRIYAESGGRGKGVKFTVELPVIIN